MFGWEAVKATSPACSPRVLGQFMDIAFESRGDKLKNVIIFANISSFAGTLDFGNDDVSSHLYERNHWHDYKYLLDFDVITQRVPKSLYATFGGGGKRYLPRTNPDNMFTLDYEGEYKRGYGEEVVKAAWHANYEAGARKRGKVDIKARLEEIKYHLVYRVLLGQGDVKFYVVLTPMTSLAWHEYEQNGQLEDVLEFLHKMLELFFVEMPKVWNEIEQENRRALYPNYSPRPLPVVEIIDAASDPALACDFSYYRDILHYSPAMDARLLEMIKDGSRRVTPDDIPALLDRLRDLARPELQPAWATNPAMNSSTNDANGRECLMNLTGWLIDSSNNPYWAWPFFTPEALNNSNRRWSPAKREAEPAEESPPTITAPAGAEQNHLHKTMGNSMFPVCSAPCRGCVPGGARFRRFRFPLRGAPPTVTFV